MGLESVLRRRQDSYITWTLPPLAQTTLPVIHRAFSLAGKPATLAISSGSPISPQTAEPDWTAASPIFFSSGLASLNKASIAVAPIRIPYSVPIRQQRNHETLVLISDSRRSTIGDDLSASVWYYHALSKWFWMPREASGHQTPDSESRQASSTDFLRFWTTASCLFLPNGLVLWRFAAYPGCCYWWLTSNVQYTAKDVIGGNCTEPWYV